MTSLTYEQLDDLVARARARAGRRNHPGTRGPIEHHDCPAWLADIMAGAEAIFASKREP